MLKKIVFCLLIITSAAFAQRKGAIETGGLFSFQSYSGLDSSVSSFDVQWIMDYHLSRSTATEFEPILSMRFEGKETFISTILLLGVSHRLFDIVPDDYTRRRYTKRDLGTTAGIYGSAKIGLWINGYSHEEEDGGKTYAGPAICMGLGTRSPLSKTANMRIQADVIYLMPNGPIYEEPRTIFKIGVGFSVFVVN